VDARVKRIGGGRERVGFPTRTRRARAADREGKENEEVSTEREINDTYRDMPWVDGQLRRGGKHTRERNGIKGLKNIEGKKTERSRYQLRERRGGLR
jgi:hypothetical protein